MTYASTVNAIVIVFTLFTGAANAYAANITEGKTVTLNGTFGVLRPGSVWSPGVLADASSVVDGVFLSEGATWNENSVWWDDNDRVQSERAYIEIDLGGLYTVESILIQADDNDRYSIQYRNAGGMWIEPGYFDFAAAIGLRTRGPFDVPLWEATAFRIYGFAGVTITTL